MKNIIPNDLSVVLKLLKNRKIKYVDKRIPILILHLIYSFFWNICYKAKILALFRGKINLESKDIRLSCFFYARRIRKKGDLIFRKEFLNKIYRNLHYNTISKRAQNQVLNKKNVFKSNTIKII